MKEKTLKDFVKKWTIESIISCAYSKGMEFMARKEITQEELDTHKKVIVNEIKRRFKQT
jgi:hypothetical protein